VDFWNDVYTQNTERFSQDILRKLFILNYAPNGMWTYFLSVYFLHNKNEKELLEETKLKIFLDKIIAFVWGFSFTNPGVNALRTPVYAEMINIVSGKGVNFDEHKFDENTFKTAINNFEFKNGRPITRSMLTWWAFNDNNQAIPNINTNFDIEHIFARKRQENDKSLSNSRNLEALGNKVLLEDKINIRAADYRFVDKIKYYKGFTNDKGQYKEGSVISELVNLANSISDFKEDDIVKRTKEITNQFINYLKDNSLIRKN
jgi:hypothetical protein